MQCGQTKTRRLFLVALVGLLLAGPVGSSSLAAQERRVVSVRVEISVPRLNDGLAVLSTALDIDAKSALESKLSAKFAEDMATAFPFVDWRSEFTNPSAEHLAARLAILVIEDRTVDHPEPAIVFDFVGEIGSKKYDMDELNTVEVFGQSANLPKYEFDKLLNRLTVGLNQQNTGAFRDFKQTSSLPGQFLKYVPIATAIDPDKAQQVVNIQLPPDKVRVKDESELEVKFEKPSGSTGRIRLMKVGANPSGRLIHCAVQLYQFLTEKAEQWDDRVLELKEDVEIAKTVRVLMSYYVKEPGQVQEFETLD